MWVIKSQNDDVQSTQVTTIQEQEPGFSIEEFRRIQRENEKLKKVNPILKSAAAFFSQRPSQVKFELVEQLVCWELDLVTCCQTLKVSRSGYYLWQKRSPSKRKIDNEKLLRQIAKIHRESRETYGAPRIFEKLKSAGENCGKKKVARLMKKQGLRGVAAKKYKVKTTDSDHDLPIADRIFKTETASEQVTRPNQFWASDITYIQTDEGWVFLAIFLDLFTRKVVGLSMEDNMRTDLILNALQMALGRQQIVPDHELVGHSDLLPYHITNRSNNKDFFYLDLEDLWKIFLLNLNYLRRNLQCKIHSFVLMSNHYHLLMSPPKANLSEAMTYLHREVAKQANRKSQRTNHFFGGRYKWTLIDNENYFLNVVKYIYRNPVDAGISKRIEDYKYSSFTPNLNPDFSNFGDNLFEVSDFQKSISVEWMNQKFSLQQRQGIQKALRRRVFALPIDDHTRRRVELDVVHCKKQP